MDAGVGHQVGLELGHVHVQGAVEAQRGCQGGDDLSDQPAERSLSESAAAMRVTVCLAEGMHRQTLRSTMQAAQALLAYNDSCAILHLTAPEPLP